jgi:hypothetical protein
MPRDRVDPVDFILALDRHLSRPAGEACCSDGRCVLCQADAESDALAADAELAALTRSTED